TGTHPDDFHDPMNDWLTNYELDTGKQTIKPYDPNIGLQIAEMVRPQFGDAVPTDENDIRRALGYGWWKQDVQAAGELLEAAGFTRQGNDWYMPNGERFSFVISAPPSGVMNRFATMAAQQWSQAGIQVSTVADPQLSPTTIPLGQFEAAAHWSIETWGGDPDLSFFLDSWHSSYVAKEGERQSPRNLQRWSDPRLDEIIEKVRVTPFGTPENLELGRDFVRLMVEEMPV